MAASISSIAEVRRRRIMAAQPRRSQAVSVPAPVGGWNARDSLGAMEKLDAVTLENLFPHTTQITLRYGYSNHATGIGAQVETLMSYAGATTTKMKAIAVGGNVYDVTSSGAVGAAELSGLSNARWQYANFTTTGGSYLCMVNGTDRYRVYDGSAWHMDTDGAPYDITGVTSTGLVGINVFKNRLWFVQNGTLKAWYLPVNAIGGAAASLDMSSLCQDGGYLMAMGTWTIDAGYGVDDYAVFVTSQGEILVWRMTDPTDANSIFLVGIWRLGAPVGRRCFFKYGGDLLLISQDGLLPLSGALQSSRLNPRVALTNKIQAAMSTAVTSYGSNFGWQVHYLAQHNQLYLNVPLAVNNQQQYVMNTITGAWCNFKGWNANCLEIYNDDLYFGGNGIVGKAWDTNADAGQTINGVGLQSFQPYGAATMLKRVSMIRPVLYTNGSPTIGGNVNYDFDLENTSAPLSLTPTTYATWDSGVWDTAVWGGDVSLTKAWQGATGNGYWLAPRLTFAANGVICQWISTDLVMERGAIL